MNILYVCYGNICRSPMAEGITKAMFGTKPLLQVKSAGLYAFPGTPPSKNAVTVCLNRGIDIRHHRAHLISPHMIAWADLVFCMERYQCREILDMIKQDVVVHLLGKGVPGIPDEIPDPYGETLETYEETFSFLTQAITFHLGHLKERRKYDRKAEAVG